MLLPLLPSTASFSSIAEIPTTPVAIEGNKIEETFAKQNYGTFYLEVTEGVESEESLLSGVGMKKERGKLSLSLAKKDTLTFPPPKKSFL